MTAVPAWLRYEPSQGGWTLQIHAQPGAKRTEIVGEHGGRLKLKIAAPAVDNRANACLMTYLADLLGVTRNQITLIRGEESRQKTLAIQGSGVELARKLEQIITTQG